MAPPPRLTSRERGPQPCCCAEDGWVPSVTVTFWVLPPRLTVTSTLSPGLCVATAATRSPLAWICDEPICVTTSPCRRPAEAAGPPADTCPITAPVLFAVLASPVLTPR